MHETRVQAVRIVALPPAPAAGRLSDPTLRTPPAQGTKQIQTGLQEYPVDG